MVTHVSAASLAAPVNNYSDNSTIVSLQPTFDMLSKMFYVEEGQEEIQYQSTPITLNQYSHYSRVESEFFEGILFVLKQFQANPQIKKTEDSYRNCLTHFHNLTEAIEGLKLKGGTISPYWFQIPAQHCRLISEAKPEATLATLKQVIRHTLRYQVRPNLQDSSHMGILDKTSGLLIAIWIFMQTMPEHTAMSRELWNLLKEPNSEQKRLSLIEFFNHPNFQVFYQEEKSWKGTYNWAMSFVGGSPWI